MPNWGFVRACKLTVSDALQRVRLSSYLEEVIFDFYDDWHCALQVEKGDSKKDVVRRLRDLADLIEHRYKHREGATQEFEHLMTEATDCKFVDCTPDDATKTPDN